jgi:hypothetical protein
VATIGPALANFDESHSALLFAQRCVYGCSLIVSDHGTDDQVVIRAVKNHARINEAEDFKTLSRLQARLTVIESENSALLAKNDNLRMPALLPHRCRLTSVCA